MLRYCAWCGLYQGHTADPGYQIRSDCCEVDTSTICRACLVRMLRKLPRRAHRRGPHDR